MDSDNGVPERRRWSSRLIFSLILFLPVVLVAHQAWRTLFEAATIAGSSVILAPLLWFTLLVFLTSIEAVLITRPLLRVALVALVYAPSVLFAHTPAHILFLLLGLLISFFACQWVSLELAERVHFAPLRVLRSAFPTFLLGLSLVLSSQYYAHAKQLPWEALVPSFDLGEGQVAFFTRLAGKVSPALERLNEENITVDQFLSSLPVNREIADSPAVESSPEIVELLAASGLPADSAILNQAVQATLIANQRESLSRLAGRTVGGEEKMSALLSEVIRHKMLAVVASGMERSRSPVPVIPLLLATLLFLSVYPVASFFFPLVAFLASLVIGLLRRVKLLQLEHLPVEQERLRS